MKPEFLRFCRICAISNHDKPLRVYTDLESKIWVYLCYECENKVLRLTGGEIPINLAKLGGDMVEWEWEEREETAECGCLLTKEQFDLGGCVSLLLEL
jgi:hypothetical protein